MTGKIFGGLAAMALLTFGTPVLALSADATGFITVGYAGIDLAAPGGRQILDRRVENAIRTMCGAPVIGTHAEGEAIEACRADARTAALPEVERAMVKARLTVASAR